MRLRHFFRLSVVLVVAIGGFLAALTSANAEAPERVELLTYHTHEPFITGDHSDLTYDLAAFLNARSGGAYRFDVVPTSRPRIDRILQQGKK